MIKSISTKQIVTPRVERMPNHVFFRFFKRMFDIIAAFLLLVILIVPLLIFVIIVRFDGGPAIFKQERLGLNGKPFMIYKLRTMVPDAEVDGVRWADKDDKRITKIGKFLRRFQIDEWPQFWNILKGQMSFVGPRPEVKLLHDEFCEYVIGFEQRLLVKPGLTGWAQVNGGTALLPEEKIMFDIEYISKRSLWFDLKCLWRTIGVIWSPKGY